MKIKTLRTIEASLQLDKYIEDSKDFFVTLDDHYARLRETIVLAYNKNKEKQEYTIDLEIALAIYQFFLKEEFNIADYSNYGLWRYINVMVIPDVIFSRYKINGSMDNFYKKGVRLYSGKLWWYIHLSWQGDLEQTKSILINNSTDTILQIVERPGKKGIHIEAIRRMLFYYSKIPNNERVITLKSGYKINVIRPLMVLHMARILTTIPELYDGEVDGYVKDLYRYYDMFFNQGDEFF